jgi:hypothetical protein
MGEARMGQKARIASWVSIALIIACIAALAVSWVGS